MWPLTWLLMVIPLFFFIGGFSNRRSWEGVQRRGQGYAAYVDRRVHRVLAPIGPLPGHHLHGGPRHRSARRARDPRDRGPVPAAAVVPRRVPVDRGSGADHVARARPIPMVGRRRPRCAGCPRGPRAGCARHPGAGYVNVLDGVATHAPVGLLLRRPRTHEALADGSRWAGGDVGAGRPPGVPGHDGRCPRWRGRQHASPDSGHDGAGDRQHRHGADPAPAPDQVAPAPPRVACGGRRQPLHGHDLPVAPARAGHRRSDRPATGIPGPEPPGPPSGGWPTWRGLSSPLRCSSGSWRWSAARNRSRHRRRHHGGASPRGRRRFPWPSWAAGCWPSQVPRRRSPSPAGSRWARSSRRPSWGSRPSRSPRGCSTACEPARPGPVRGSEWARPGWVLLGVVVASPAVVVVAAVLLVAAVLPERERSPVAHR